MACTRNEKVLYISFEESEAALVSAMRSSGTDLSAMLASGRLRLLTAMPEAMGAEQHLVRVLVAIKQMQPNCVVIESASACKRMGTEQAAFKYLMRLINTCKDMGIGIWPWQVPKGCFRGDLEDYTEKMMHCSNLF